MIMPTMVATTTKTMAGSSICRKMGQVFLYGYDMSKNYRIATKKHANFRAKCWWCINPHKTKCNYPIFGVCDCEREHYARVSECFRLFELQVKTEIHMRRLLSNERPNTHTKLQINTRKLWSLSRQGCHCWSAKWQRRERCGEKKMWNA